MRTYASRLIWIASVAGAVASGIPSSAHAGPLEQFAQVLWNDAKPERIALRYENSGGGLIVSDDGGRTFALVCSAAIGPGDLRGSTGLMDGEGRIWLTSFDGIAHDDGTACSWEREQSLADMWATDVVLDPIHTDVKYAITSGTGPTSSGLFRSEGQGAFARADMVDDARPTRLRIVRRGDGVRLYESAVRGMRTAVVGAVLTEVANYVIRYSDDGGAHWTEHAFEANEGSVRLEAVDPSNPERIVVSVVLSAQTTLYVSSDGGATFERYHDVAALGGIALTPEGRVYLGDAGDLTGARKTRGLWFAENLATPVRLLSSDCAVKCLGYRASDSTLFLCESYAFGVADLETGKVTRRVSLMEVEKLVECSDRDVRGMCRMPLLDGYCGLSHFPCAPMCDAYELDLTDLYSFADSDPAYAACFERRNPGWKPSSSADGGVKPNTDAGQVQSRPDAGAAPGVRVEAGCAVATGPRANGCGWLLLWAAMLGIVRLRRLNARRCPSGRPSRTRPCCRSTHRPST